MKTPDDFEASLDIPDGVTGRRSITISLILLFSYFLLKPLYFFSSGYPQIADISVILLFVAAMLFYTKINANLKKFIVFCFLFSIYCLFVSLFWSIYLQDIFILVTPLFYIFNVFLIYSILALHKRHKNLVLKYVMWGIMISAVIQTSLSLSIGDITSGRQIIYFNNPNQLGYWALLSACMFAIISKYFRINLVYQFPVFLLFSFLAALSLSKAAMVSFALLLLLHFGRTFGYFVAALIVLAGTVLIVSDTQIATNVMDRIENIGKQSDDNIAGRGYQRIWTYPQHLIFGAGESGYERFPGENIEIHSTLGTVIFSYGFFGTVIFIAILWQLYRISGLGLMIYLLPPFTYGVTHQGLRFSLFWVLLAVIAMVGVVRSEAKRGAMTSAAPMTRNLHNSAA